MVIDSTGQSHQDGGAEESPLSDLVLAVGAGSRHAEALLLGRYSNGLMILLQKRTGDPELAKDLRQDALQLLLIKLREGAVKNPESVGAFVRQIAINLLIEHKRKAHRRGERPDSDLIARVEGEREGPIGAMEQDERAELVQQVLEELPTERDRHLLRRYYLDQETKPVICAELDLTPEHFDRVLYRAKRRLKQLVEFRGRPS
ncbi:MAG: sigma-70 family RNA polymerase sigma factor [Pseudomonadota bacterium]